MEQNKRTIVGGRLITCFVSLMGTIFLFSACENRKANIAPKKAPFNELFAREEQITLSGDSLTPVFSFFNPLITKDKIYVCDYMGHYVAVYDKAGKLMTKFGRKGKGPEEFQMPYGVDLDAQGNLYINDRQNQRVQIYDPFLKFLKATPMPGQNEVMLVRKTGEKPNTVMVGTATCAAGFCLVHEYDWEGRLVNSFAQYEKPFVIYSWAAAHDEQGNVYLINILEQEIKVFDLKGTLARTVKIASPSTRFFKTDLSQRPKSTAALRAQSRVLNEEEHTRVRYVFVNEDLIFVQLERKRGEQRESIFILDIFDLEGSLRFHGMETPGMLCCITDKFYFVRENTANRYGAMEIEGFQFKSHYALHR
jgi:hypothetical protein